MRVSIPELIDRLTILRLKIEKTKEPEPQREYNDLKEALYKYKREGYEINEEWLTQLYEVNKSLWELEASIIYGKEEKKKLEEIGRIAIKIRELNKKRTMFKNKIAKETSSGYRDVRINYL